MPDLTDPKQRTSFMRAVRPMTEQLTPATARRDGAAYLDQLKRGGIARPGGDHGLLHGGRLEWQIVAAHPDRVVALAAFHPGLLVNRRPLTARTARPPT